MRDRRQRARARSSASADEPLTLTSIFLPLIVGGEIRVYDGDPITRLRKMVEENDVNFLKATPSHLKLLDPMPSVRKLVVGGEQLTRELARSWPREVFNEYGPTEATVGCVIHKFDPSRDQAAVVPIGTPIANASVRITSDGELLISGDCVANGYVNASKEGGFKGTYRTGDRVSLNDEGELVYEGRMDRQIKVNGMRVEPFEVEWLLSSIEGVTACAAGLDSRSRFVAYYVGGASDEFVRSELRRTLPPGVVPTRLFPVIEIPLSPNGKTNFDQPDPDRTPASTDPISSRLRSYVSEILKQPEASIPLNESLTRLGLDSLSLVLLLDRLAKAFYSPAARNVLFDLAHEFMACPSIEKMASVIKRSSDLDDAASENEPRRQLADAKRLLLTNQS